MVPAGVSPHFAILMYFICSNFMIIQLGILAHAFPPSRARTLAFATFSAGQALGAVFGSNVAAVLTEFTPCDLFLLPNYTDLFRSRTTWRSPFYLLSGLAVVVLTSGLFSIDADLPSKETDKRIDWIGAFLVTTGLVLIIFVLGQGEIAPRQWATPCT
jgi:MFS family permease